MIDLHQRNEKSLYIYMNFGKARTGKWLFPLDYKTKIQAPHEYQQGCVHFFANAQCRFW